jgi:hypothetical protein
MSPTGQLSALRYASDLHISAIAAEHKIQAGSYEEALTILAEAKEELELATQWVHEAVRTGRCPDGGTCHHQCQAARLCSRVIDCGPLSGVFPGDRWPEDVRKAARGE